MKIIPYLEEHQSHIDKMMMDIASEFEAEIFSKSESKTISVPDVYWVLINKNEIIGTVGLQLVNKDFSVLKNMMLKRTFRGKSIGASKMLIETVINFNIENRISKMYLGTMFQFKAAQSYYSSNGFNKIDEVQLPKAFQKNLLDSVFYMKEIIKKAQPFS